MLQPTLVSAIAVSSEFTFSWILPSHATHFPHSRQQGISEYLTMWIHSLKLFTNFLSILRKGEDNAYWALLHILSWPFRFTVALSHSQLSLLFTSNSLAFRSPYVLPGTWTCCLDCLEYYLLFPAFMYPSDYYFSKAFGPYHILSCSAILCDFVLLLHFSIPVPSYVVPSGWDVSLHKTLSSVNQACSCLTSLANTGPGLLDVLCLRVLNDWLNRRGQKQDYCPSQIAPRECKVTLFASFPPSDLQFHRLKFLTHLHSFRLAISVLFSHDLTWISLCFHTAPLKVTLIWRSRNWLGLTKQKTSSLMITSTR